MHERSTRRDRTGRSLHVLSELELLERSRVGDVQAYGELFARHRRFALRVATSVTSSRSDAEDLVALAVENTLRALINGSGPSERFDHYVAVAIRRLAARLHATRLRFEQPMDDLELHRRLAATVPATEVEVPDAAPTALLAGLSRQDQDLLWATEVDGWTPADLSTSLGTSPGAAAARTYRARLRLRKAYAAASASRRCTDCPHRGLAPGAPLPRPVDVDDPCIECGHVGAPSRLGVSGAQAAG